MRKYLIYTSAGTSANVRYWVSRNERDYDIWITNYSGIPGLNREYADFYNEQKGTKIPNLYQVYLDNPDFFNNYKAIMAMDDDVIISPKSLNKLFQLLEKNDLWMLQPAFYRFGKVSHPITRRRLTTNLRYVNFVEITCPIIRTDKLLEFLDTYTPSLPTIVGIDYWLPYFWGINHTDKYAISDQYYCINPRDQFKDDHRHVIDKVSSSKDRAAMINLILKKLGIKEFHYQEFSSVSRPITQQIIGLPLYLAEIAFDFLWSLASNVKQAFQRSQT